MHHTRKVRRGRHPARYREAKRFAKIFKLRNACAIIALYIVTRHPFLRVLRACGRYGGYRNGCCGTKTRRAAPHLGVVLCHIPKAAYHHHGDELFRAGDILRKAGFGRGRFLVFTESHVSAVVDGQLEDWTYTRKDVRRIWSIYEVRGDGVAALSQRSTRTVHGNRKLRSVGKRELRTFGNRKLRTSREPRSTSVSSR